MKTTILDGTALRMTHNNISSVEQVKRGYNSFLKSIHIRKNCNCIGHRITNINQENIFMEL